MMVSHVIPSRNQASFIRRCIDGCLDQTFPRREVIVVDGASTDGTPDVLASYGDRIRWLSEPDGGQSDAVNKGVNLAHGDVIAWINSDDRYADEHVLERVMPQFEADVQLDVVYGDGLQVDVEDRVIKPQRAHQLTRLQELLVAPSSFVMQPAVFFRKELFLAVGGLDVNQHWAPDYDLWLRLFPSARRIRYLPEVLAYATYHPRAKSVSGMPPHIREVCRLKLRYAHAFRLNAIDRLMTLAGMGSLYAYLLAVKLKLRRAY